MNTDLLLVDDNKQYPHLDNVDILNIYKKRSFFLRVIRRIHFSSGLLEAFEDYWLGEWKNTIRKYSRVIVFDELLNEFPLLYINKCAPNLKLVLCYRNRVGKKRWRNPVYLRKVANCIIWTYSKEDARLYNLNYYCQFIKIEPVFYPINDIQYDFFFIGTDKGRIPLIREIKKALDKRKFSYKLIVVPDRKKYYSKEEKQLLGKPIEYNEVISNVKMCRCVIDLVSDNNYGMTYRCLEATFLKKKLITNYLGIKECDFYNKNNVFIWGEDDPDDLKRFIDSGFEEINEDVLQKYSFKYVLRKLFRS